MKKYHHNKPSRKFFLTCVFGLITIALAYLLLQSSHDLTPQKVNSLDSFIQSHGIFAPAIIILFIFLTTLIPPFPVPIRVIELVAGIALGFFQGAIVVWIAQISSSLLVFYLARILNHAILHGIFDKKKWQFYQSYVAKKGFYAVLFLRVFMIDPFNIVSYLAGLTKMSFRSFALATIIGTVPESLLYPFLGSVVRNLHTNVWYLLFFVIMISFAGFLLTFPLIAFLKPKTKQKQ